MFTPIHKLSSGVDVDSRQTTVDFRHTRRQGSTDYMPAIAGMGSKAMQKFVTPALQNSRMVQVGAGAGTYGAITRNLGANNDALITFETDQKEENYLPNYFNNDDEDTSYYKLAAKKDSTKIVKESETLLLKPIDKGMMSQTTTIEGRKVVEKRYYENPSFPREFVIATQILS